jgi:hypothetical protein
MKEDDEGTRFHTLLTAGMHHGGRISSKKWAATVCSSWWPAYSTGEAHRRATTLLVAQQQEDGGAAVRLTESRDSGVPGLDAGSGGALGRCVAAALHGNRRKTTGRW